MMDSSLAKDGNNRTMKLTLNDQVRFETSNELLTSGLEIKKEENISIDIVDNEFYSDIQAVSSSLNKESNLSYITSRSMSNNVSLIEKICTDIETICKNKQIPIQESVSINSKPSIDLLKYLICNTKFFTQLLLANDTLCGHFVNKQPPFSSYLLMEILWHLHYEKILAESVLYFPLDLCYEILEVLPRCLDIPDFQRSNKFLSTIVTNVYKKLVILKDCGTQSKDVHYNVKRLVGTLQELLLQYKNERFLQLENIKKTERYKRQGIILKKIIQMVKTCFTFKAEDIQIIPEMEKMYKLTFGQEPLVRVANGIVQQYLEEMDRELINLLLEKVKEIDCHIYLNWTEYNDEENTSLSFQRAIGLECHYFVEHTKKLKNENDTEYNHLVECMLQIASKPDPKNKLESLQIEDLTQGVSEGKKDCLTALFKRYKEWDNTIIDLIANNYNLFSKVDCEEIFEHFTAEINNMAESSDFNKIQNYSAGLLKSFLGLKMLGAYELTIQRILRYEEIDYIQNVLNIKNFEKFIMLNPNFSTPKNLKVVLFHLCLQPRLTLKIILKIAIGHSDYPNVAVNLDDLMSLLPIMKIQMESWYENEMITTAERYNQNNTNELTNGNSHTDSLKTVSFVIKTLQEICLESSKWNKNKFTELLYMLYSFCEFSEVINEIFTPILVSKLYSADYTKWVLVELEKLSEKFDSKINQVLPCVLEKQAFNLFKNKDVSKFVVDESLTLTANLTKYLFFNGYQPIYNNFSTIFLGLVVSPAENHKFLTDNIERIKSMYKETITDTQFSSHLETEDIVRYLFFSCTNQQYSQYVKEITDFYGRENLHWLSKLEVYDNLIRLTFESCLLCLEYPSIGPQDSVSFFIRRLHRLILNLRNFKMNSDFLNEICKSLKAHVGLVNQSIEQTSISKEYAVLLNSFHESNLEIDLFLNAMDLFALACIQKSSLLKTYNGPNTLLGTKFWLAHEILDNRLNCRLLSEDPIVKNLLTKLDELLK